MNSSASSVADGESGEMSRKRAISKIIITTKLNHPRKNDSRNLHNILQVE
jgi:hypothetical protein